MPQTQSLDKILVSVKVLALEVVQELPPLADHHEKTATGMKILLVGFQVLRQATDSVGQDRNLNFRRSRIRAVDLVFLDDFLLLFTFDHGDTPFLANPESQKGVRNPDPSAGSVDILPSPKTLCKGLRFPLSTMSFSCDLIERKSQFH